MCSLTPHPTYVVKTDTSALSAQLRHQLTLLTAPRAARPTQQSGLTIWSTADGSASVYWHWTLSELGTPVIANPLSIRSNLRFAQHGTAGDAEDQLLGINGLVNDLPWQQEVLAHLSGLQPNRARNAKRAPARTGGDLGKPPHRRTAVAA